MGHDDRHLEDEAQHRGEEALEACYRVAYDEDPPDYEFAGPVCDGPCHTCIVREVLSAAWDPMLELARREVRDLDDPEVSDDEVDESVFRRVITEVERGYSWDGAVGRVARRLDMDRTEVRVRYRRYWNRSKP